MRYKNVRTGAVVDSSSIIKGKDWEEFNQEKATEEVEPTEEYVEEEVNLEEMTNKELEKFAEEQGIKLTTEDKKNKDTRIAAITKAFE
ncbi:hypothetical protein CWR48_04280 [Oceanobacillus arenosus]|uniref:Uncharacterized protein n=1 Tax=Oceanobacillus arenosus TaxID=1229153 RepID=A0A3D8PY09_9BACI|nr:hypothetical protein [Oceanobacillus arenosus]RDW21036.1 hypothetical protein CWR48_04280 [Oceanobacillus arenosus]